MVVITRVCMPPSCESLATEQIAHILFKDVLPPYVRYIYLRECALNLFAVWPAISQGWCLLYVTVLFTLHRHSKAV